MKMQLLSKFLTVIIGHILHIRKASPGVQFFSLPPSTQDLGRFGQVPLCFYFLNPSSSTQWNLCPL